MKQYYGCWNMTEKAFDRVSNGLWIEIYYEMTRNQSDRVMNVIREAIRNS